MLTNRPKLHVSLKFDVAFISWCAFIQNALLHYYNKAIDKRYLGIRTNGNLQIIKAISIPN